MLWGQSCALIEHHYYLSAIYKENDRAFLLSAAGDTKMQKGLWMRA